MKYNSVETFWEVAARTKMGAYLTEMETTFFLESIAFHEGDLVCDIGAGAGKFSLLASARKANVIALDIDRHGLTRLKAKDPKIEVIIADAKYLPLKDEVASAAFTFEVVDYIPELNVVLSEAKRILTINSPLVFSFGNLSSLKSKIRELSGKRYMHSYKEAVTDLQELGFQINRARGFAWLLFNRTSENPFIPSLAKLEWALGFRRIPRWSPWVLIKATKP